MKDYLNSLPFQPRITKPATATATGVLIELVDESDYGDAQFDNCLRILVDGDDGMCFIGLCKATDDPLEVAHIPMFGGTAETFGRMMGQTHLAVVSEVDRDVWVTVGQGTG